MTVAGRRPPSRWSWRSAFGARGIVSSGGHATSRSDFRGWYDRDTPSVVRPMHHDATRTLRDMAALGSVQCPIIVGRDELLELGDRRLTEAAAGRGQLLLLSGEAGVGKTRLLGAIRRKARSQGFVWANGSVAPQDLDVPAALIMDLARTLKALDALGTLGEDLLAMRIDERADALGSRRIFVLDVVDRILDAITGPTLLDFEDLQWADDVSLEIIGVLAKRIRDRPVMLIGAYRTEELPPGAFLREWRSRLISQRLAEEARLVPLTRDQTALMTTLILSTGLPAPREVVQAVYERTNGFPLHIEELLGALDEEARTDGRKDSRGEGPGDDRGCDPRPDRAAVTRRPRGGPRRRGDRTLLHSGRPRRDHGPATGRSRRADPGADPEVVPLRRRRSGLDRLPPPAPARRPVPDRSHRPSCAGSTRARPSSGPPSTARRRSTAPFTSSEPASAPRRIRAALSGAETAGRAGSRRESFELYRRAVANIPDSLPLVEEADLYREYANAAEAIEQMEEQIEAAGKARERYLAAGRPVEAAVMLLSLVNAARKNGASPDERRRVWDQFVAELETLPASPERDAAVLESLSYEFILDLDELRLDEAAASNARYRELAARAGDPAYVLDVEFNAGMLDVVAGRIDVGLRRLLGVAREGRERAFESIGVTAYRIHATYATQAMEYRAAESAMVEGLRYADAIEQSHCRQQMAVLTSFLAWAAGRWDDAVEIARQELVERGCRRGVVGATDVLGYVALGRGDVDEARRRLAESLETNLHIGDAELVLPTLWGIAELELVAGNPVAATAACEDALARSLAGERALLVPFVVTGVRAALGRHRPDEAERWLDRVRDHLAGWELAATALAHADGLLKLSLGSLTAARESLETAVRGWDERGRIWEATWARLDLAHCLLRSNRFGEAATLVTEARLTADRLG